MDDPASEPASSLQGSRNKESYQGTKQWQKQQKKYIEGREKSTDKLPKRNMECAHHKWLQQKFFFILL